MFLESTPPDWDDVTTEEHDEDKEQDLRDPGACACNAACAVAIASSAAFCWNSSRALCAESMTAFS